MTGVWGAIRAKCKENIEPAEGFLWVILIGFSMNQLTYLLGLFFDFSFTRYSHIVLVLWLLYAATVIFLFCKRRKNRPSIVPRSRTKIETILFWSFAGILLIQVMMITTGEIQYPKGEMTVEIVNAFLSADDMWTLNPLTGMPYTAGVPFRIQILGLPAFYGAICKWTGLSAQFVILRAVPLVVLCLTYLAFDSLAKVFYPNDSFRKRIFLLVAAFLFLFGAYMDVMDGFGLRYAGFAGTTIRNLILVPTTIASVLRKDYWMVLLCIFVETCIVWTLYGLGFCVLTAIILSVLMRCHRKERI
ncbi:MAG: DUF6077 domain-containing protein [Lachnospiraceae bacterium]|jgi:hypothetical protein|nr:DUF6077 domain-containing protein [Lachnospiraceae bacterium]